MGTSGTSSHDRDKVSALKEYHRYVSEYVLKQLSLTVSQEALRGWNDSVRNILKDKEEWGTETDDADFISYFDDLSSGKFQTAQFSMKKSDDGTWKIDRVNGRVFSFYPHLNSQGMKCLKAKIRQRKLPDGLVQKIKGCFTDECSSNQFHPKNKTKGGRANLSSVFALLYNLMRSQYLKIREKNSELTVKKFILDEVTRRENLLTVGEFKMVPGANQYHTMVAKIAKNSTVKGDGV